jgi:hypothetical protein
MRVRLTVKPAGTVADLDKRKDLTLCDLSQDVESVKQNFGNSPKLDEFDGFLVKIEDGEYTEVYGYPGNIAYTSKPVFRIVQAFLPDKPKAARAGRKAARPRLTR